MADQNLDSALKALHEFEVGKKKTLNDKQQRCIAAIEQLFWENGSIPSDETVSELAEVSVTTVKNYYKDATFRSAIMARGIDFDPESSNRLLNPDQLLVANMLLNLADKRSLREKLKQANVSTQQYHAWLRTPAFSEYLRHRAENLFQASDASAYTSLINAVESGDTSATKFFFEMRGIYNPKVEVNVNIQQVIVRLVEIVAKYVKDPEILRAIAAEVEVLDSDGRPRAAQAGLMAGIPTVEFGGFFDAEEIDIEPLQ